MDFRCMQAKFMPRSILSVLRFCRSFASSSFLLHYLVFATLCAATSANNVPKASILPLHYGQFSNQSVSLMERNSQSYRRNLLGEARMWLYGHVLTRGYYYTNVWVGSPAQRFSLIVDTGSTVTYVPCSSCTECGVHQDSPFLPSASSTYHTIDCHTSECPQQQCDAQQRCTYQRHYAEESSSSGLLASDIVGFGDASTIQNARLVFGCETAETGDLYTQKADGIIGLGHGQLSIMDQLVNQGAAANIFSLCYGGMERGGGAMILGETDLPDGVVFTPLNPSRLGVSAYYNLMIEELRVAGKKLVLPSYTFEQGYGTVLDSGTTFTYLPRVAFNAFVAAVKSNLKSGMKSVEGPDPKYADICFSGASNKETELGAYFPQVDFVFGAGAVYKLSPENYLFRHRKVEGAYCLGFFSNEEGGTLLGGILVRNTLVTYDRARSQVGFYKTQCEDLFDTLNSGANQTKPSSGDDSEMPNADPAESPDQEPEPVDKDLPPGMTSEPGTPSNVDGLTYGSEDLDKKTGCLGCAASIVVTMSLPTPDYDRFRSLISAFVQDMARELGLRENQFEMAGFDKGTPLGVKVHFQIVPNPPATYISSATAQHIRTALMGQELGLRDAFGGYTVDSIKTVPIPSSSGDQPWWVWFMVGFLVVSVILAIVGGGAWWYRRRQQLSAYANMGITLEDEDEEKAALGSGNNGN